MNIVVENLKKDSLYCTSKNNRQKENLILQFLDNFVLSPKMGKMVKMVFDLDKGTICFCSVSSFLPLKHLQLRRRSPQSQALQLFNKLFVGCFYRVTLTVNIFWSPATS